MELVGLVAAAGQAIRLGQLSCSKEILSVRCGPGSGPPRPRAACEYLLEKMHQAGFRKVYIVIREGKWDIPSHLGDGHDLDMQLAYLMMRLPYGPPYSLDQAYEFLPNATVAFGFPDILFHVPDVFVHLLKRHTTTGADVVLALFSAHRCDVMDMVDIDDDGRVVGLLLKPPKTHLRHTWIVAIWTRVFTRFMHRFLADVQSGAAGILREQELSVGHVLQAAIRSGVAVNSVTFPDDQYLDIGTPEALAAAQTGTWQSARGALVDDGDAISE